MNRNDLISIFEKENCKVFHQSQYFVVFHKEPYYVSIYNFTAFIRKDTPPNSLVFTLDLGVFDKEQQEKFFKILGIKFV